MRDQSHFSQDGTNLLLSNGAGGCLGYSGNGIFWTMPASGGTAAQVTGSGVPYTGDALALPAATTIPGSGTKYIVYAGNSSYSGSSRCRFSTPPPGRTQVVIDNSPGATTSIAINPKNNSVYVGVGYGPDAGNIYSFTLSQIDSAYNVGNADRLSLPAARSSIRRRPASKAGRECSSIATAICSPAGTG